MCKKSLCTYSVCVWWCHFSPDFINVNWRQLRNATFQRRHDSNIDFHSGYCWLDAFFFLFRSKVYQTLFFIFIFRTLAFRCRVWLSTFPYFRQIKSNYCAFFDHLNFPLLYRLPLKRCYNDVLLEWLMSSPLLSFSFERTHKNENSDFFYSTIFIRSFSKMLC